MKQMQKKTRKNHDEQPEAEVKDVQNEQLAEDTEDLLLEIECCLAEAEADNLDEKKAAKAEWDEIGRQYDDDLIDYGEAEYQRVVWAQKYDSLFDMRWCCGSPSPSFGDLE